MQSPGKQREPNGALHAKDERRGGIMRVRRGTGAGAVKRGGEVTR